MKKIIELKSISKSFDGEPVLDSISLDIHDNEFITLLGPSGCGKTTTLRIIGGFETPDEGDVIFMGERINDVPPHKRHVNTVFQKYALFPHLNVFENVAFPLRERKVPKAQIQESVNRMLDMEMCIRDRGSPVCLARRRIPALTRCCSGRPWSCSSR